MITTRIQPVVDVTPSFGFADTGGTLQFSASVANAPNQAVTWSAAGGSIDATASIPPDRRPGPSW